MIHELDSSEDLQIMEVLEMLKMKQLDYVEENMF
jgi:hypothetical protein